MNKKIFGIIFGLLLVFSFTKSVNAQICGAVGQPCCDTGSACGSGLECEGRFCKTSTTNSQNNSTGSTKSTGIDPTSGCANGINTAIGCISVLGDQNVFLGEILRWAIGVGGGIAFLLIVYAGFMIMSSAGSPDRLKAGQELMTSAISGIILLVLSIFVLRVIGVDILKIPGFGQ